MQQIYKKPTPECRLITIATRKPDSVPKNRCYHLSSVKVTPYIKLPTPQERRVIL